jgi:hypothetical protein
MIVQSPVRIRAYRGILILDREKWKGVILSLSLTGRSVSRTITRV